MLNVALERDVEGDLMLWDIGQGLSFRPGVFDGVVSVSVVQWLCNQDKSCNNPVQRIKKFFISLYNCLARGAKAVLQIYPENSQQVELLVSSALKAGFGGGLLTDYPNSTRAKKHYLVLFSGIPLNNQMPKGLGVESEDEIKYERQRRKMTKKDSDKPKVKSRSWILAKKERQRRQGLEVRHDSKYTGRKRRPKF